ncbi:ATP-grasp domain-containing protein [Ancylobacter sp.]|uniref:ATP-grasp domain-containing protein n=1 Tax=Ancylobacter sp. TaxID=1872567 RepID=UPI003D12B519
MSAPKVLIVGTTGDYIAALEALLPGRLIFLTDRAERTRSAFRAPEHEVIADLRDTGAARQALESGLPAHASGLSGLTCFDCESLPLAAMLAREAGLAYPSPTAVAACRDKYQAKRLWQAHGIACPAGGIAQSPDEARRLSAALGPVVLKPRTGSGGAFTTSAASPAACVAALANLQHRLARSEDRLFAPRVGDGDAGFDARTSLLIEACVAGPEFSADFVVDGETVTVLRTSRKVLDKTGADFGETLAYVTPAELDEDLIALQLRDAARALGLQRALCTADFILSGTHAVLLEIAPRPGGDCLPRLTRHALGRDILRDAVDFAEGRPLRKASARRPLVGLMLRAATCGTIEQIDASDLHADMRTVDCVLTRGPGDRLGEEGPADRVVGEVVFAPHTLGTIEQQCRELRRLLRLQMATAS